MRKPTTPLSWSAFFLSSRPPILNGDKSLFTAHAAWRNKRRTLSSRSKLAWRARARKPGR
eukprot:3916144-Alexandrium_andersonii.AAC.1